MKISETETPNSYAFIKSAANYRTSNAAFGDGTFLDAIMKLMEQLIPLFMGCFASKEAFVENVTDLSNWQKYCLQVEAVRQARKIPELKTVRTRRAAAEAAVNGIICQLEEMNDEDVAACYDELK
jgi:hypothetical protein